MALRKNGIRVALDDTPFNRDISSFLWEKRDVPFLFLDEIRNDHEMLCYHVFFYRFVVIAG